MSRVHVCFTLLSLAVASPGLDLVCPSGESCSDQQNVAEQEQLVADVTPENLLMLQLATDMPTQAKEGQAAGLADERVAGANESAALSQINGTVNEKRAQGEVHLADGTGNMAKKSTDTGRLESATHSIHGDDKCRCIGIDHQDNHGHTIVSLTNKEIIKFPSDLGAHCAAWDDEHHPLCKVEAGKKPSWCGQPWCFVDPCECDIAGPVPRVSAYLPRALWQGVGVYFLYTTCGGIDTYTNALDDKYCVNQKTWEDCESLGIERCEWTLSGTCVGTEVQGTGCGRTATEANDEDIWGLDECACIGIDGKTGTTEVSIHNESFAYPGDLGSTCKAWDKDLHPDCLGADPKPAWCESKWCYVDPCQCTISTPPKVITYLPDATYEGAPVYYSYNSCGNEDLYTSSGEHPDACVNQKTPKDCAAKGPECTWTTPKRFGWEGCIGTSLATRCSAKLQELHGGCSRSPLHVALMLAFSLLWW